MKLQETNIIFGECEKILKNLDSESVRCVITSPPYYQQRNYGAVGEIGNENTIQEYVERLCRVFEECKRVLTDDGTIWLNLGDKYKNGRLLGVPWRVALALQDEIGLYLRSDIIWHKPNAMPSSVKTRPTTDHEYIFMFSKSPKYFYNADAIREEHVTFSDKSKMKGGRGHFGKRNGTPEKGKNGGDPNLHNARWDQAFHPKGRNKRTVWNIALSKFPEAHFAVFPEILVETCLKAGSEIGDTILDPFVGSGTTAVVALKQGRNCVGIDANQEYCNMARQRVDKTQPLLI
jgi:site-specific DNA-methyltransferase (adenine-specific)